MIRAVIFDMDGVIVDSIPIHLKIWISTAEKYGIPLDNDLFDELNGMDTPLIAKTVIEKYHLDIDPAEVADFKKKKAGEALQGGVRLFPGVLDAIRRLKMSGYKIGLATSTNKDHVNKTLGKNYSLFDEIVTDDDIMNSKPAPDIFMKCAEVLDIPYEECVVVEDSINGIIAAKKAGMKAVAITNTTSAEKFTMADAVISKIDEIDRDFINDLESK